MGLRKYSFNTDFTVYFCFATSQAIASYLFKRRKVRTAQSNAPVKSRLVGNNQERVPQKITAFSLSTCGEGWGEGENVR